MATHQPEIEWVGIQADSLSAQQHTKLKAFVDGAGPGLLGLRIFPNFDALSNEMPSGMVAIYSTDARVDASILSDDLFQVMAVKKVLPPASVGEAQDADAYFEKRLPLIQEAVAQTPPGGELVREATRKPATNEDTHPWAPQLGGRGAFAGVYSCARDGDTRKKDFYFVVRAGLPNYVADLKRDLAIKQPVFRDLMYGEPWQQRMHFARNASSRNACRILANLGEACQVPVYRMADVDAKRAGPDCAQPEMAISDWEHVTHSIEAIDWHGKPAVAVSYGVVPSSTCLIDKDFFVVANPYDGISRFPLSNVEDIQSSIGLPIDTGRKMTAAQLVGQSIPAERLRGVAWEAASSAGVAHHPDLHEDAFRPLGKEFKAAMRQMGWNPEHHPERLLPIAVKIGAPEVE
jgi:hypothetical protein